MNTKSMLWAVRVNGRGDLVLKYYICLELGGTNLRYGIVGQDLGLVEFSKISTQGLADAENKVEYLRTLLEQLILKVGRENVLAVTMALASLMDKERTVVYSSPMVKNFDSIPLAPRLTQLLGLTVFMEKDVNILLLYELSRLNRRSQGIAIGVFIGTGLGNAMCIDGHVYKGSSGAACELGHIPVPGLETLCGCGKRGCIELLACSSVLNMLAREKYNCHVSQIFTQHAGAPDIRSLIYHCALAIATEVTVLDPEVVILGGGVVEMEAFPLDYLVESVKENLRSPNPRESFRAILASGDEEAGVLGTAIHASHLLGLVVPQA